MKNPGWIDLQVNGHNGVDFSNPELTEDMVIKAAEELFAAGTEIFLPTIITGPMELYRRNIPIIKKAVESHGYADKVPGVHLEGPFISNTPGAVGAHNPAWVQIPSHEAVDQLNADGFIKIITIGADAQNAPEAISRARELGIHVSVGHHMADYAQVKAAADAGAELLTHLGNGCPNLIDRHNNPVWAGLAEERLTAMCISDGHHLPGELLKVFIRTKGVDKMIITSDQAEAAGFKPGRYFVLGNDAVLEPNGKLHNPVKKCLVGSASTMSMCMAFLESLNVWSEDELTRMGRTNALNLLNSK